MIYKYYEANKINLNLNKLLLLYGKNEGLKNEIIVNLVKNKNNIFNYEEKEIIDNQEVFFNQILSKSLFENEKIIIIKRATDKILQVVKQIDYTTLEGVSIIISAENLEKKSKLRAEFEKRQELICIPFYPDTEQTLFKFASKNLNEKGISISPANLNLVINKCNGDRENLINELNKIELYCKGGKKITSENITKITNLLENHSISELVDNCLVKNKKKIIHILNENNFTNDDCILITRTFLNKAKKINQLAIDFTINKNIELTISSAKPPIFWKDKEVTKQQIFKWSPDKIKILIYQLNELELRIKKNINNSINFVTDFILDQSTSKTNN